MMIYADFQSFMSQQIFYLALVLIVLVHFAKKFLSGNDEIKSAAKELATKKAVSFLERFFK